MGGVLWGHLHDFLSHMMVAGFLILPVIPTLWLVYFLIHAEINELSPVVTPGPSSPDMTFITCSWNGLLPILSFQDPACIFSFCPFILQSTTSLPNWLWLPLFLVFPTLQFPFSHFLMVSYPLPNIVSHFQIKSAFLKPLIHSLSPFAHYYCCCCFMNCPVPSYLAIIWQFTSVSILQQFQ